MSRKKGQQIDENPQRNWCFKVKRVLEGADEIEAQMVLAWKYHNKQIEIERERRDKVHAVCESRYPDLVTLKDECFAATEAFYEAKKTDCKATKKETTSRLKKAMAAYKDAKKIAFADPDVKAELVWVEQETRDAIKAAYNDCGCYWGTSQIVNMSTIDLRRGPPPRFRSWRWEGWEGAVGVQIQSGKDKPPLHWANAFDGKDTRLRMEIQDPSERPTHDKYGRVIPVADPNSKRSQKRAAAGSKLAVVSFRVASNEDKSPVWAKVLVHLHREPPPGTKIKRLALHRRLVGNRICWTLRFVLQRPEWSRERAEYGNAEVSVGYKVVPDGLQIASYIGSDRQEGTLVLKSTLANGVRGLARWAHAESLQSLRDDHYNVVKEKMLTWLKGKNVELAPDDKSEGADLNLDLDMPVGRPDLPAWCCGIKEDGSYRRKWDIRYLKRWKRPEQLGAFYLFWKTHRFTGDRKLFAAVEEWYLGGLVDDTREVKSRDQRRDSGDDHYHNWQDAEKEKAIRWRNGLYRAFAAKLAKNYKAVTMKKVNWKTEKEKARAKMEEYGVKNAKEVMATWSVAAPGTLDRYIVEAMGEENVVRVGSGMEVESR